MNDLQVLKITNFLKLFNDDVVSMWITTILHMCYYYNEYMYWKSKSKFFQTITDQIGQTLYSRSTSSTQ